MKKLTVRKLYQKEHFDEIVLYNKKNIGHYRSIYPNYDEWIREIELGLPTASILAIGGFYKDEQLIDQLAISAILRKNNLSLSLEVENLVIHRKNNNDTNKEYIKEIVYYIHRLAEERGFAKITVEIVNRSEFDEELIQTMIDEKFVKSGRQEHKYNLLDEIVFLTLAVDTIFSIDPYDNLNASKWIIEKYFNPKQLQINEQFIETNGKQLKCKIINFYNNIHYNNEPHKKLNSYTNVIVIRELLKYSSGVNHISSADIVKLGLEGNIFIFDFTTGSSTLVEANSSTYTILNRIEINSLLPFSSNKNFNFCYNRINQEDIGGLLLVSNETYFPFLDEISKGEKIQRNVYIKMGKYGEYLSPGQKIFYAYYEETSPEKFSIWGYSEILTSPIPVDINLERADLFVVNEPIKSLGTILFNEIKNNNIIGKLNPLWEIGEFEKHNNFNPSNKIIYFILKNLIKIPVKSLIDLRTVCNNIDIHNIFDFYLSKKEVKVISEELNKNKIKSNISLPIPKTRKEPKQLKNIVIITALPDEYSAVKKQLVEIKEPDRNNRYANGFFKVGNELIARVYIVQGDRSNSNSSAETMAAYDHVKPYCMLFVGIAGSLWRLKFGDVAFGSKITHYEKRASGKKINVMPTSYFPSSKLLEIAKIETKKDDWLAFSTNKPYKGWITGIISGNTTIDSLDTAEAKIINDSFYDHDVCETEGAGFMNAIQKIYEKDSEFEYGVIRGISDVVVKKYNKENDTSDPRPENAVQLASENAASFACWLIYKLIKR